MVTVKDRGMRREWNFDSRIHTHTYNPDMTEGKNMRRTLMEAVIVVSLPACFAHNDDQSVSPHTHLEPQLQHKTLSSLNGVYFQWRQIKDSGILQNQYLKNKSWKSF